MYKCIEHTDCEHGEPSCICESCSSGSQCILVEFLVPKQKPEDEHVIIDFESTYNDIASSPKHRPQKKYQQ